jgi:hypothetical protein
MSTTIAAPCIYRIAGRPRISQSNPAFLWCTAVPELDPLADPDQEEPEPIRVLVRRQFAAQVHDGTTFSSDQVNTIDGLALPVFTPDARQEPQTQPQVPAPVQDHSRVTRHHLPEDRDHGWGDDDALNAPGPRVAPSQVQPQHRPEPAAQVAQTIKQREAAVLDAGKEVPLELVRTLRITAKAYNMVSTLIGATGRPGPQDVRALVITNIIAWAKNDQGLAESAGTDLDAQAEAMEKLLKAQL